MLDVGTNEKTLNSKVLNIFIQPAVVLLPAMPSKARKFLICREGTSIQEIAERMKKDIEGLDDVKRLVDGFYDRVREDELLAPVFNSRINDWQPHLETMYKFWNAVLFGVRNYVGTYGQTHSTSFKCGSLYALA